MWEEFRKAMEQDFLLVSKQFGETVWYFRRVNQLPAHVISSWIGLLLSSTKDVVGLWKEFFEDLLTAVTHLL